MPLLLQLLLLLLVLSVQLAASVSQKPSVLGPQKTIYDDLLQYLFSNESYPYNANAMPICQRGQKLEVGQDMVLLQLFDLDEPTQQLTVDVWVESTWRDCRLSWDPAKFNGVDSFAIKSEELWYPDLIFYESLHGNFEEGMFIYGESTARVYSDGSVQLGNQVVFKVFCRVNIASFPYDSQRCNITFSSWTKDIRNFRLRKKAGEAEENDHAFESASNGEWLVQGFPSFEKVSRRKVGMDEARGEAQEYSEVIFELRLKRKYLFYQTYMLFPCMLLTWLALFVFLLPARSGEKIAFVTTILLSLVVFLLLVADNIPRSGDAVPLLGMYFCLAVGLVSVANIKTIVAYSISLRSSDYEMPAALQKLLLRCGWLLGLRMLQNRRRRLQQQQQQQQQQPPQLQMEQQQLQQQQQQEASELQELKADGGGEPSSSKEAQTDWELLGVVFDRIFFVVYFVLNLIVSIWILACAS